MIAAFFAGAASIAGAGLSLRRVRKQDREECAERMAAYERGLERGTHMNERDA